MYKNSKQQTFEKALSGNTVVVFDNGKALITAVNESRGYQTNYQQKRFFYFVDKINRIAKGITNDSRKHNLIDRINNKIISAVIVDKILFNELLKR